MANIDSAFDLLQELSEYESADVVKAYTEENCALVASMAKELLREEREPESDAEFCELVRRLVDADAHWNRQLGEALWAASLLRKNGKNDEAATTLAAFIENCPSSAYQEIARTQAANYFG